MNIEKLMNVEAEEAILGCLLLDPKSIELTKDSLPIAAFVIQNHQVIYRSCLSLHGEKKPCDLMAVATFLEDRELLEVIGGMTKLSQLLNRTVGSTNLDRYIKLVLDKYKRRQLVELGNDLVELAESSHLELSEIETTVSDKIANWLSKEIPLNSEVKPVEVTYKRSRSSDSEEVIETVQLKSVASSLENVDSLLDSLRNKANDSSSNKKN